MAIAPYPEFFNDVFGPVMRPADYRRWFDESRPEDRPSGNLI
jgi:hypothetical protein